MRRPPDTDIPCAQCHGARVGRYGQECGACFGSGLSTAPWDQRRNATTVTQWEGEALNWPPGAEVEGTGKKVTRWRGSQVEYGVQFLISWPNPHYRSPARA